MDDAMNHRLHPPSIVVAVDEGEDGRESGIVIAGRRQRDALGAPVAMKGCSRDVVHKSELGIVKLGVSDAEQALRDGDLAYDLDTPEDLAHPRMEEVRAWLRTNPANRP